MRPRTREQLATEQRARERAEASTDLDSLEKALTSQRNLPNFLRRELAENHGREVIEFVKQTMDGTKTFKVTTMVGTVVEVPGNPNTRLKAAITLGGWCGFDATIIDEDGDGIPNVIVLPATREHDPSLTYVDEELDMGATAEDAAAGLAAEVAAHNLHKEPPTVDPDKVAAVLAKRRQQ